MFIGGITAVLIGQGLPKDLTNTDYVELIIAPHLVFSFINESFTFINPN